MNIVPANVILFATNHCEKYPIHSLSSFIRNSINSNHVILKGCCLVQYEVFDNKYLIHSIFFNDSLCEFKKETYMYIRDWFMDVDFELEFEPLPKFKKILGV